MLPAHTCQPRGLRAKATPAHVTTPRPAAAELLAQVSTDLQKATGTLAAVPSPAPVRAPRGTCPYCPQAAPYSGTCLNLPPHRPSPTALGSEEPCGWPTSTPAAQFLDLVISNDFSLHLNHLLSATDLEVKPLDPQVPHPIIALYLTRYAAPLVYVLTLHGRTLFFPELHLHLVPASSAHYLPKHSTHLLH